MKRKAWSAIEVFIVLSIAVLGLLSTLSAGESAYNDLSTVIVDSTTYQGHTMLIYTKGTSVSVCHSPECKKCTQIYD